MMAPMSYLENCLSKRILFFSGKGGAGKGTVAWATALLCHRHGKKVAVFSWNPLENESVSPLSQKFGIPWHPLETLTCFKEYSLHIVRFEALYRTVFDNALIKTFVMATPGLSESVIAGKILDTHKKNPDTLLIVDLPATGHAVSFFKSPYGVKRVVTIGFVHRDAAKVCNMFEDPNVRLDLVTLPEELSMVETIQLKSDLNPVGIHFGYLHINGCTPPFALPSETELYRLPHEIRQTCVRHKQRIKKETEIKTLATELQLPTHEIPRVAKKSIDEIVENIAAFLEKAA